MWKIIDNYDWDYMKNSFDWIKDMEGVKQNPRYHAEGDVEVHTKKVLEELLKLEEYQELDEQQKHILIASVLLHDVEKRSTTVLEPDGRYTSKGHAKKGEYTSRQILYKEIKTTFYNREQISKLVRHHGLPLWVFDRPDPRKSIIRVSLEVDTKLLAILAKADAMGRICEDQQELLYRIELFKELCIENHCYGEKRKFENDYSKFFYFQKEDSYPDYIAYDDTKFEVIMMSALPGSGKDTYIKQNYKDWPQVSLDEIRNELDIKPNDKSGNGKVIQLAKERAKQYMRISTSFIWNATNITKQMRQQLIDLFVSYGASVKIVYVEVPYKILIKQNSEREEEVPQKVINKLISKLEVPVASEAHSLELVVKED